MKPCLRWTRQEMQPPRDAPPRAQITPGSRPVLGPGKYFAGGTVPCASIMERLVHRRGALPLAGAAGWPRSRAAWRWSQLGPHRLAHSTGSPAGSGPLWLGRRALAERSRPTRTAVALVQLQRCGCRIGAHPRHIAADTGRQQPAKRHLRSFDEHRVRRQRQRQHPVGDRCSDLQRTRHGRLQPNPADGGGR